MVSASTRSFTNGHTTGTPLASVAVRLLSLGSKKRSACPYLRVGGVEGVAVVGAGVEDGDVHASA